jgi:ribonuclease HI
MYKGAILPLLMYGAPVWFDTMRYELNRQKYVRVQRLINLKMARAYHTTSSEALCILTGMTPIMLKIEEAVTQYKFRDTHPQQATNLDQDVEYEQWPHPAKAISIEETQSHEEPTVSAYIDGSKYHGRVGSGIVIYKGRDIIARQKAKLEKRCSNNQAEMVAIHKALEAIDLLDREGSSPLTAIIYTDSRISIDSLKNPENHSYLVEKIRRKVDSLVRKEWRIKFSWVKAHTGTCGNEIADGLAKEAARSGGTEYEFARIPKSTIYQEAREAAREKWKREWTTSQKAAATRQYYSPRQTSFQNKAHPKNNSGAVWARDDEGILASVPPE